MRRILEIIAGRLDQAELFALEGSVELIGFESGRLKSLNTLSSRGLALRGILDGRLGQTMTSDMRDPEELARRLHRLAGLGDPVEFELAGPAEPPRPVLVDPRVESQSLEEIIQDGQEAVDHLRESHPRAMVHLTIERARDQVQVMTTAGADVEYQRLFTTRSLLLELVDGQNIIQVSRYGKGISQLPPCLEMATRLSDDLTLARRTVEFQPGSMRVLFAPASLADVLMAFTGAVDGDLVAKGVSPLAGKLDQPILDPRITILDDPLHPDGILSGPVDDEGTPSRRKAVIDQGRLRTFLADRRAAARLKIEPTGNGFRSTPFERYKSHSEGVATEFSNLVMEPGEASLEELRGETGIGIEVHQINGILLGDLIGGDFSGSLEVAYLIRDGKRIGRIKDAMIAGNFFQLFRDQVAHLSAEREWSGTFGGCSGSFLLPWIAVEGVEISA